MQIVCLADNTHEMSDILYEKKNKWNKNFVLCSCDWYFKG